MLYLGSKLGIFIKMQKYTTNSSELLTLPAPCTSEGCIKMQINFLFSHFTVPQKVLAFIKPFEAPQRSEKIKI